MLELSALLKLYLAMSVGRYVGLSIENDQNLENNIGPT